MRLILRALTVVLLCAFPLAVRAQYWRGYFFIAPTAWSEPRYPPNQLTQSPTSFSWEFGGGLERLLFRGIGIGADLQGASPEPDRQSDAAGFASFNVFYHFRRLHELDPFVTGGYALSIPYSNENTVECGGGIAWWGDPRYGLMLEFREFLPVSSFSGPRYHVASIRIGLMTRW